jgi:hypothetical protein
LIETLDSIRLQAPDQFGQRISHGAFLHLLAANIAVFSFDVKRLASVASCGNANQSNRITVFVRIRSRDAGDGHSHIGGRTVKRAFGHRHGYLPTDRALCLEEFGVHAKRFDFVGLRINDKASVQVLAGARSLR